MSPVQNIIAGSEQRVQVSEKNYRHVERRTRDQLESFLERHSIGKCFLGAVLDHRTIGNRIRKRHADLEDIALQWAGEINGKSPTAQRMLKFAFNLADDGMVGQQVFAGEATRLAYMTDEAVEGKEAFLEKRDPDWSKFPYYF